MHALKGIVFKSTGSWYTIRGEDNKEIACRIKGKLRLKGMRTTNPLTVGDVVQYELEDNGQGIITDVEPRKNHLIRRSVNLSKREHLIAANIDLALLMVTVENPLTLTGFIDRFLVSVGAYHIPAVILINKKDAFNKKSSHIANEWKEVYLNIGYRVEIISVNDSNDLKMVKELIENKTIVISGHSGVGKSSIINAINPDLKLGTGEISEAHGTGTHKTTFSEMFELQKQTYIIDTPGIKSLGIIDIEKQDLSHYFPEFLTKISECKFHNCLHVNEPSCAVKNALEKGDIQDWRYKNYLDMLESDAESYRGLDY